MDTNGWDMVYTASAESLNSMLKLNAATVAFTDSASVKYTQEQEFNIKVSFKGFSVMPGGSDKYIVLELKTDGTINDGKFTYKDLVSRARFALELFSKGSEKEIRLKCSDESIEFIDMDTEGSFPKEQSIVLSLLSSIYSDMIVKHREQFSYCFAQLISLNNPLIGMKQFDYAWYQPENDKYTGFLAVLGVTDDRDISNYPRAVDDTLLFGEDGAAYDRVFLAAKNKFLKDSMIPALKNIFMFSEQDNFILEDGSVKNNGNVLLSPFAVGGTFYNPYINDFNLHIDGDKIVTVLSGRCPITDLPDSYVDFTLSAKNSVVYNSSLSCIELVPDPNMTVTAEKNIPSYVKWLEILSLGTMNLIINGVTDAVSGCIKTQLAQYSFSSASVGSEAVAWAVNVIMDEGGVSDGLYLRGRRLGLV